MPNDNTHVYVAHQVSNLCNEKIRQILFSHIKEYYLGAIIFDTFKYSRGYVHFSRRLHGMHGENTSKIVLDCLEFAKNTHDRGSLAAVFGMLTHMQTDIHIHPMVYSVSGHDMYRHMLLETAIDKKINDSHYANELVYPNLIKRIGIAEVFAQYLRMDQRKAMKLMKKLLWRQLNFGKLSRGSLFFALKPFIGNARGMFYRNPDSIEIPKSYIDPVTEAKVSKDLKKLIDESIEASVELIDDAFEFYSRRFTRQDMENFLPGESLISGKVGVGINQMKLSGP